MAPSWFSKKKQVTSVAPMARPAPPEPHPHPDAPEFPEALSGVGNIDRFGAPETAFDGAELELVKRVEARVLEERYDLPHIPSTHVTLLDLIADPETDLRKVEQQVAADMVLTASMLRVANSVMYGGTRLVDSVRGAILRIGLRGLRSMLYSQSVKSVIFRGRGLVPFAEEIWRQACSVAVTSRNMAVPLCLDPERTYTLGLLHDIGKIPLLSILRKEAPPSFQFHAPFVGAVLNQFHEQVGERLTTTWNLPQEIVAVTACHHAYADNLEFSQSAALVNLAHRQDLVLSSGDQQHFEELAADPAMEALLLAEPHRAPLLQAIRDSYTCSTHDRLF